MDENIQVNGKIKANISDFEHGYRFIDAVKLVRIKSKNYSLLIMEDYYPSVGAILGTVEIVTETEQIDLGYLEGYYMIRKNEFNLIVEKYFDASINQEIENEEFADTNN